jgi:tetratricopeptide (TPR) repeat protein
VNAKDVNQPERNGAGKDASARRGAAPSGPVRWLLAALTLAAVAAGGWWLARTQSETMETNNQPHHSETSLAGTGSPPEAAVPPATGSAQEPPVPSSPQTAIPGPGDGSRAAPAPQPTLPSDADAAMAETLRITQQLVADFPRNPDALEVAARAQFVLGSASRAEEIWQDILALNPRYAYAHAGLGTVAARKGEHRQAVGHFRRALEIDPTATQARLDLALALFDLGETKEATRALQDQLRQGPSGDAHMLLGLIAWQEGDAAEARKQYAAAVHNLPQHAAAHLGLANAYTRLGQTERAREAMAEFQKLRADEHRGRQTDLRGYDDTAAQGGELGKVCMNASRIYHVQKRTTEAERLWRLAAAVDAANVDSRQALAWMHRQRGQLAEAIRLLTELAAIEPANSSYPLEIGRLHVELGQRSAAENALLEAYHHDPRLTAGHAALARLYLEDPARKTAALVQARAAVDLQPTGAHYALLGEASRGNGDRQAAREAFQRASELAPENSPDRRRYERLSQEN